MNNGQFTFYVVQYRLKAQNPWLKEKPITKIKKLYEWQDAGQFIERICYLYYIKNEGGSVAYNHSDLVEDNKRFQELTGLSYKKDGFIQLQKARKAKSLLKLASEEGQFNYRDGYNKFCQSCRYDFRLVQRTIIYYLNETVFK